MKNFLTSFMNFCSISIPQSKTNISSDIPSIPIVMHRLGMCLTLGVLGGLHIMSVGREVKEIQQFDWWRARGQPLGLHTILKRIFID